jgi:hypothetical protein
MGFEIHYPALFSAEVGWSKTRQIPWRRVAACQMRQLDEAERVPVGHWLQPTMHLSELAVAVAHLPVIPTRDE